MALHTKTAFLVIHGIGRQKPFETLDQFGRGMVEQLREQYGELILSHALQARDDTGRPWQESFLRIHPKDGDGYVDIREYYWAHFTERKISTSDIWAWLRSSLGGAKRLCEENKELRERFQRHGGVYSWHLYRWRWVLFLFRLFSLLPPRPIRRWFADSVSHLVISHISDIAIYTSTDQKTASYAIRQNVLQGATEAIIHLLSKHKYDKVVICGHSLGSVIAYDAINKLNIKTNMNPDENFGLDRLAGFVSFGSPLDKIAYFFREHVEKEQYIRRQIIDQLFSFRAHQLRMDNPFPLVPPLQPMLDHIQWVNYYSKRDPISDHLVFSKLADEDNVLLDMHARWGKAHNAYWRSQPFYKDIVRRFLGRPDAAEPSATANEV